MQCKDGKWNSWIFCINFKIVAFGSALVIMNIELQHRGINLWIATFGKINILNNFSWTWRFPQTTNNIMGLNFEFPMENDRRKFNPVLKIDLHYEWIYKFSFESPTGGNPTLILPTLPIQKVPKKASKILQKCNSYFEQENETAGYY